MNRPRWLPDERDREAELEAPEAPDADPRDEPTEPLDSGDYPPATSKVRGDAEAAP